MKLPLYFVLNRVIQLRIWHLPPIGACNQIMVASQEDIDQFDDLSSHATDDLHLATVPLGTFVIVALDGYQPVIECLKRGVHMDSLQGNEIDSVLQEPVTGGLKYHTIFRCSGLLLQWTPSAIASQFGYALKVGDGANSCNEDSCVNGADHREGSQDTSLARCRDGFANLDIQGFYMLVEQGQLFHELPLFNEQAGKPTLILRADGATGQILKFSEFGLARSMVLASVTQVFQVCTSYRLRRWIFLSELQSGWCVRVCIDLRQFGKQFITNGSEFILSSGSLMYQLQPMLYQAVQQSRRIAWWYQTAGYLAFVGHDNVTLYLIVQEDGEGLRITLIALLFAAFLGRDAYSVDLHAFFLEILFNGSAVVTCVLKQDMANRRGCMLSQCGQEFLEAGTGLLKGECGASFIAMVLEEELRGQQRGDMAKFAYVDSNIQG